MRTPAQVRFEAAYHEAAHAVAFHWHGRAVESIHLMTPDEAQTREQGDEAGHVIPVQRPIQSVCETQEAIVELLAGEAGVRIAWATHLLSNDEIGGIEVPTKDFTLEELTASPNGATPEQERAHYGWYERYCSSACRQRAYRARCAEPWGGWDETDIPLLESTWPPVSPRDFQ